jgi:hypothetical protein
VKALFKIADGFIIMLGLLVPGISPAAPGGVGSLRAGVAKVSIMPDEPVLLNGYAGRDEPAKGSLHTIWAKALVLEEKPGNRVVFLTTDLLGLSHEISEEVARQADSLYGIKRSQLLMNSSHTHSAPIVWPCVDMIYDLDLKTQRDVVRYGQALTVKLVKVIGEALKKMGPAQLSCGHGEAEFAINRRDGEFPAGPIDHDVPVLRVTGEDGRIEAILFGYACHNTTLVSDNYLINGDYAGFAQIALEAGHPGAQAMFLMGCGGDQNPAPRGTAELAEKHGKELAAAVERVLGREMKPVEGSFRTSYATVELPFRPFDVAQYRKDIVGDNKYLQRRARLMLEAYNKGFTPKSLTYPIQAVRFGKSFSVLALSEEVVVDYSLRAKREFAGENLYVSGYSSEVMCYLPSERVLKEGGYEGGESMIYYGQPGPFASGVEERVFGAIHKVMKNVGAGN